GVDQVQLSRGVQRGARLLPRDGERPHVPAEPARAAVHVPLARAAHAGRARGCGARRAMNDVLLRADEVHKAYDGLPVLQGVSLDVELVREVLDVMEGLARDGMTMVVVS